MLLKLDDSSGASFELLSADFLIELDFGALVTFLSFSKPSLVEFTDVELPVKKSHR